MLADFVFGVTMDSMVHALHLWSQVLGGTATAQVVAFMNLASKKEWGVGVKNHPIRTPHTTDTSGG